MSLIDWKSSYSVNVPEFDAQHRRLIALINDLHEAMIAGKAKETLGQILNGLVGYTKVHFAAEEKLLAARAYPDLAAHKSEHDKLTAKAVQLQSDFHGGRTSLSIGVMTFLKTWLEGHILGSDKKYGVFLAS